jgi:hypothetical protein
MFWKKDKPSYIVVDCAFNCLKEKCPKWVILDQKITQEDGAISNIQTGKCAIAWIPLLLIELKESMGK